MIKYFFKKKQYTSLHTLIFQALQHGPSVLYLAWEAVVSVVGFRSSSSLLEMPLADDQSLPCSYNQGSVR